MRPRLLLACSCVAVVAAVAWLGQADPNGRTPAHWEQLADKVYRTKGQPYGYAVVSGTKTVLIDAPLPPDTVKELGVEAVEAVLLTHHHRDTALHAAAYRAAGVPVRAAKEAVEWLTPEAVAKHWKESIPLRTSRAAYFVLSEGVPGVDCTLADGKPIPFGEWSITPIATPGHSRDHFAFRVRKSDETGSRFLFCGDALAAPGKLWAPFTTDWDHWTDIGLKPTAESLRKLAKLDTQYLCPAHGPVITKDIPKTLTATADAVTEAGFMKSFERFTKDRLGNAPKYNFLVPKEQVASAGDKPWSRVSDHLWITGNTYVLKAKDGNGILVLDPWGQRSADQVEKLRKDEKLGPVEVVGFSHAHYDHFDGIYVLNGRDRCEVWGLALVARPLKEPFAIRAPFLDARPIKFTKEFAEGDTASWGGYTFKFHHLPGQTWFTSGIEATIDGKRCMFTADNFFHQDQYSGTGGWMGLNHSSPVPYGTSAKKVLDIAPEWVLAEHGGPYEFDAEDYRRRVKWGEAAGKACDTLSVSGSHLRDWTPHRVSVEPVLQTVKPGGEIAVRVIVNGSGPRAEDVTVRLNGRGRFPDQTLNVRVNPGQRQVREVTVKWAGKRPAGRHVFPVIVTDATGVEPVDPFFAVDVPGS